MDKETTLSELSAAKKAHIKWVNRAKTLIEGFPVEKEAIPVDSTECQFGTWFYGDGQRLYAFSGMDCLEAIESLHFQLHDTYFRIFSLYFGEDKRSFFSKLLNRKKKISDSDKAVARGYFSELEEISKKLLGEIGRLERRLNAMSIEAFESK